MSEQRFEDIIGLSLCLALGGQLAWFITLVVLAYAWPELHNHAAFSTRGGYLIVYPGLLACLPIFLFGGLLTPFVKQECEKKCST